MNQHLTEIAFVLDRSGSMQSFARSAVDGFNEFLREQQAIPGEARFTLVLFDDEYLVPVAARSAAEVTPLNAGTYVPRGSTALLDAIGLTVDGLGQRLAATPESARPGKVIVAILTDGQENASYRYTAEEVAARIRHQREKYGWEFLFLGANQDAIATAAHLHIDAANAATFQADAAGAKASFKAASRKAAAVRCMVPESADRLRPLSEINAEEDSRARGGQR